MSDNDSESVTWEPIHSTPTANRDSFIEERDRETLSRIATSLRSRSISIHESAGPSKRPAVIDPSDPALDPDSPEFDHYKWAQATIDAFDKTAVKTRRQGVLFRNLTVSGSGSVLQFQKTVATTFLFPFYMATRATRAIQGQNETQERPVLRSFDGVLTSGELLLVLGRPGSGCSTFLKTITGHLDGLKLSQDSHIHYNGLDLEKMVKEYRGEVAYNQEVDIHFPHLTVGETLEFAGYARAPHQRGQDMSRDEYVKTVVQVIMAVFGLSHTYTTKVGDNFVRGVSGGERKRVSIAEMALSRARMGAWDNSTRGLDSANALQFIKSLRVSADLGKSCHAVAAYQASQSMYDLFDKVVVLYEGREIYFGPCGRAVQYFEGMGWQRPLRQVAGDFLTAITNPGERKVQQGMEDKVPRSAAEFEAYWRNSSDYQQLRSQIATHEDEYPFKGEAVKEFKANKQAQQARHVRPKSPYLLSVPMQIRLCIRRAFQRLRNDLPTTVSTVFVQIALSLIIGSIYYNSPDSSSAFFQKGAVLYFALLMNALLTINEIMQLYAQRPIVEKQAGYAFAHPFAEALASILIDLPIKFSRCAAFSIVLYFMANLRREPSRFFIFFLFLFTTIVTMSGVFRSLAAMTKTIGQAMALAGVMIICMVVYAGFTLPQPYMHPWLSWIRWINPIFYSFEGIVANEFHGRVFECAQFVPDYPDLSGNSFICSAVGAIAGQRYVSGDQFIARNYQYYYSHTWRNYGIVIAFLVFFNAFYLVATELRSGSESKAECLIFRPGHAPQNLLKEDLEKDVDEQGENVLVAKPGEDDSESIRHLPKQTDVFSWRALCYDIPVKEGTRRLLDGVNGWVKPGTLTALMGVSGAGKTTLLDVLAQRVSIGVVTGDMLVNGKGVGASFQRKAGYVQQQDLHLETATVREALQFSAMLRQPKSVTKKKKFEFVEDVIQMLGMNDFAEAVVGQPGEGLNVEQRKLLTIGVELAAKPALLIFLDEPTSGLDSQSSWAICVFMRKLADHGQAVLATIHQPSALLFQQFDRLLLLAKGGRTVYFGDIGEQSQTMLDYFESNGARHCHESENPAEYILEVIGVGAGKQAVPSQDWVQTWNNSRQLKDVVAELDHIGKQDAVPEREAKTESHGEFAMPLSSQFYYVCLRVFQQYYRQPEYILAKFVLGIVSGLFIGFSFWQSDNSQQGFQNVLFSLFLMCTIFSTLVNQIMPKFLTQRTLYEVRERPSKVYSWKVFIISQILVELPWQILLAVCAWASFYFSVFGADQSPQRKGLVLLFIIQFYIFASSFAQLVISALPDATLAAMFATLMFALCLIFNGVMQPPSALPGFWIFMNRVSPLTYYIGGISSTALHGRPIQCSDSELSRFDPPPGQTCGKYLSAYLEHATGQLYNANATEDCQYCPLSSADQYLAGRDISWDDRWRNYGIFWAYFGFNVLGAITLYYVFRVKKWSRK